MLIDNLLGYDALTPESWLVILITPPEGMGEPVYKIFSGWGVGDQWRLSSGAADLSDLIEYDDCFLWRQSSGTRYQLNKHDVPNFTEYMQAILMKTVIVPARAHQIKLQFFNADSLQKALQTAC